MGRVGIGVIGLGRLGKEEVEGVFASEANLVETVLKVNPQTLLETLNNLIWR